jgi:hypothetical protein
VSAARDIVVAEVGAEGSIPSVTTTQSGQGFQERFILGSLAACVSSERLTGCLVGKGGVLRVRGVGLDVARSSSGFVAQAGPRFMVSQKLASAWSAAFRVELLAALVPWGVTVDYDEVWTTPAVGISMGVDLIALVRDNPQP